MIGVANHSLKIILKLLFGIGKLLQRLAQTNFSKGAFLLKELRAKKHRKQLIYTIEDSTKKQMHGAPRAIGL